MRSYAAGYVRKNAELTTLPGRTRYTRNPLYLGIAADYGWGSGLRRGAGGCWACWLGVFALIYIPTIQGRGTVSCGRTSRRSMEYARRGCRGCFPGVARLDRPTAERAGFSRERYLHHREYNSLIGAGAIYLALGLKIAWSVSASGRCSSTLGSLIALVEAYLSRLKTEQGDAAYVPRLRIETWGYPDSCALEVKTGRRAALVLMYELSGFRPGDMI